MESKTVKILAIDDNKDNLIVLKALLKEKFPDAKFFLEDSGKKGIEQANAEQPDVILLDVVMPIMDGFEVCTKLKSDERLKHIPIIILTAAKTDKESRIRMLEIGADAFLAKPIDEAELTAQVKAMLRIKKSEDLIRKEKKTLTALVLKRTEKLEKELGERKKVEESLKIAYTKLKNSKEAAFNLMDDLKSEMDEHKRAEEALQVSEERFRVMAESSIDAIIAVDVANQITFFSRGAEVMFGYTAAEALGQPTTLLMSKDQQALHLAGFNRYLATRQIRIIGKVIEATARRSNGELFPIDLALAEGSAGGEVLFTAFIRDITKRKQTEIVLAAEKERLAVTLRSIGDGVITTDINGNIVMLNKAAEELTGWNSDEAVGHPLPDVFNIIYQHTRQQCENPVKKVLATSGNIELENHSLIAKDGREIVIADSGAPIHDNENQIVGVVLVFRDMTERQELEDVIQKSQKLESLGVLAGGIAHDFNNILGGIYGYLELANLQTTEENVSTNLAKSLNSISRARALTQQLLTFAQGGMPIKNVEHLFPFVQETAQFALSGSSVSSRFQIQENLWPCDFDKNQIGQVIDNLFINAQQAMPNGGMIEVTARNISLSAEEHTSLAAGNYVKLSIKDQGMGIPKEFLPRIFDPYYTTKPKGHGLGLATCYSIVKRHGGYLDVESELGKGSTFHVYLPASIKSISTAAEKAAGKHSGSGTFLVMDDEVAMRAIIKRMLESFGYTVVLKENGKDAIDFFATEIKANRKLAGMIFDLTIPGGMGGKEAIGQIRKICSDTPAFVASGYSEDPIMAKPKKYGFNASLPKPFMIAELSDMLEKNLKKHK